MDEHDIHYENDTPLRQVRPERLEDGEHDVWTTPEAVRVSVEVRGGKRVRWRARDRDGKPLKLSFRKANGGETEAVLIEDVPFPPPPRPDLEDDGCYVCYPNPLPTGPRKLCYRIPCFK